MATNEALSPGRKLKVASAATNAGDAVCIGAALTGVAQTKTDANGNITLDTSGVYKLSVKGIDGVGNSAVAVGDVLYFTAGDTPHLNKKNTGVKFGVALEAVASGATATIQVKLGKY